MEAFTTEQGVPVHSSPRRWVLFIQHAQIRLWCRPLFCLVISPETLTNFVPEEKVKTVRPYASLVLCVRGFDFHVTIDEHQGAGLGGPT